MITSNVAKRVMILRRSLVSYQIHIHRERILLPNLTATMSTAPNMKKIQLPPNLKIDPKTKNSAFSPFKILKVDAVPLQNEEEDTIEEEENEESSEELDIDEEEDDEVVWFVPPQPTLVVPLPGRLNVAVLDKSDLLTEAGSIHLSANVFGQDPIRVDILKRVVQYQRDKKRGRRKAKSKTISEVSGSGRKVRAQKGGGIARAGHSRPAHWRGGARAHGPKGNIQDYTTKLNKHVRKLGLVNALSQKLKEGNLILINDMMLESHRTNELSKLFQSVGLAGKNGTPTLLVDWLEEEEKQSVSHLPVNLVVASGNIPRLKILSQGYLNVFDIIKYEKLIMTLSAVTALEERLEGVTY